MYDDFKLHAVSLCVKNGVNKTLLKIGYQFPFDE